jgi:hypothetical protein
VNRSFLHVANGTCTTRLIEAAGLPGARSIWADPLYEGPVPAGLSDEQLIEVRTRYLTGSAAAGIDPVNDMRRWRQAIDASERYDELVLWFEHDLFDQLNLIQLLSWLVGRSGRERATLICIGSFPGRPTFKGLGELSPAELASLFETRQPIRHAAFELAERAWSAFREPSPDPLDDLRQGDTAALPYLARAFERFLQEYPWTTDGLSRSERRLLRLAETGPIDLRAAFPRMHEGEDGYYITDASFADLAATLSRTTPALLTTDIRDPRGATPGGTVTLTDAGREVLSGRRDRVACGIDRWLGGVHLHDGAPRWRWDAEARRMTRD